MKKSFSRTLFYTLVFTSFILFSCEKESEEEEQKEKCEIENLGNLLVKNEIGGNNELFVYVAPDGGPKSEIKIIPAGGEYLFEDLPVGDVGCFVKFSDKDWELDVNLIYQCEIMIMTWFYNEENEELYFTYEKNSND